MMRRPKQVGNKRCSVQRKKTRILNERDGDCVVYCLTNRINGRMYGKDLLPKSLGWDAIAVYGRDAVRPKIFEEVKR